MSDERSSEFQRILNQYALYVSRGQSENDFSGDDVMVLLDRIAALELQLLGWRQKADSQTRLAQNWERLCQDEREDNRKLEDVRGVANKALTVWQTLTQDQQVATSMDLIAAMKELQWSLAALEPGEGEEAEDWREADWKSVQKTYPAYRRLRFKPGDRIQWQPSETAHNLEGKRHLIGRPGTIKWADPYHPGRFDYSVDFGEGINTLVLDEECEPAGKTNPAQRVVTGGAERGEGHMNKNQQQALDWALRLLRTAAQDDTAIVTLDGVHASLLLDHIAALDGETNNARQSED